MLKTALILLCVIASCHRRAPMPVSSGTLPATVAVSPYDIVSPFLCSITTTDVKCVCTMDVRFRRGQTEAQFSRGHQFGWHDPKGVGKGLIYFGCAGTNECGQGYFMYATGGTHSVTPYDPARVWTGGNPERIPYGSHGILEVTVEETGFTKIANRWAAAEAGPQLKAGPGIAIDCTDQACTIGLLK